MSEKINNNLNPENLNSKSNFEFLNKDLIEKLYKLFIYAENPNNPRNKNVLEGKSYTIPFLAARLNLNESYVLSIFMKLPGCKIFFSTNKPPQVYFQNRGILEKFLKDLYENQKIKLSLNLTQQVSKKEEDVKNLENQVKTENNKEENKVEKIKTQNENIKNIENRLIESGIIKKNLELNIKEELKPEPLKYLDSEELEYLKLIVLNNADGIFLIHRPKIDADQIKKANLNNIHGKRIDFIKKCLNLGIVKRLGPSKFKFNNQILKYLID